MPDLTTKPMTYDQAMTILQDLVAEYELNVQPYEVPLAARLARCWTLAVCWAMAPSWP